jgi:hypothetical protein
MGRTCLHCGKPLGSTTTLCYDCRTDGVDPGDVVEIDDEVVDRLERYFVVSSTKCANCGGLHGTVTIDGDSYTAGDFGIESIEDWNETMDDHEAWIRDNPDRVRAALTRLEAEWPHTVAAVRDHVL